MTLAVFDIPKAVKNAVVVEPTGEYTTGTIRIRMLDHTSDTNGVIVDYGGTRPEVWNTQSGWTFY
ncbi:hypothetical protein QCA50_000266 [Cerrena zonata]|uniref:Uncharacterized protein n=1 Tax=Cerrena zonata TaxID=2478898 RepID=A0AAW0GWP8_9APHY